MHLYTWSVSAPLGRHLRAIDGGKSTVVPQPFPYPSLRPNLSLQLQGDGSALGSIGDFSVLAVPQLVESEYAAVNGEEVSVRRASFHADLGARIIELRPQVGPESAACFFCDLSVGETFVRLKSEGASTRVTILRQREDTRARRENSGFALVELGDKGRVVASRMKPGVLMFQPTVVQQMTLLETGGCFVSLEGDATSLND